MSKPISANFEGVEAGAQQIITRARGIEQELEAFQKNVRAFFETQGGAARDAVVAYQSVWDEQVRQLNSTLAGAGQLVSSGNSELQSTDVAMSNLF